MTHPGNPPHPLFTVTLKGAREGPSLLVRGLWTTPILVYNCLPIVRELCAEGHYFAFLSQTEITTPRKIVFLKHGTERKNVFHFSSNDSYRTLHTPSMQDRTSDMSMLSNFSELPPSGEEQYGRGRAEGGSESDEEEEDESDGACDSDNGSEQSGGVEEGGSARDASYSLSADEDEDYEDDHEQSMDEMDSDG